MKYFTFAGVTAEELGLEPGEYRFDDNINDIYWKLHYQIEDVILDDILFDDWYREFIIGTEFEDSVDKFANYMNFNWDVIVHTYEINYDQYGDGLADVTGNFSEVFEPVAFEDNGKIYELMFGGKNEKFLDVENADFWVDIYSGDYSNFEKDISVNDIMSDSYKSQDIPEQIKEDIQNIVNAVYDGLRQLHDVADHCSKFPTSDYVFDYVKETENVRLVVEDNGDVLLAVADRW